MDCKDIECDMGDWYEIISSVILKVICLLVKLLFDLVMILEYFIFGWEKRVVFMIKGEKFVFQMYENGSVLIKVVIDQMIFEEVDMGIYMFKWISQIFVEMLEFVCCLKLGDVDGDS